MDPKASSSHPEWEKRMSSLDKQEREVHQSQLRLIRDQTFSFVRDLAALKTELFNQKMTLQSMQASSEHSLSDLNQKKHQQLMDQEVAEMIQQTKLMVTQEKLYSVQESIEQSFREALQKAQLSIEERVSKRLERLEQQLSDLYDGPVAKLRPLMHADVLGSLRSSQEKCSELLRQVESMKSEHKEGQRATEQRCSTLLSSVEQLTESRRNMERNLSELRATQNEATKTSEELRVMQKQLKEGQQALERRVHEMGHNHGTAMKGQEDLRGVVNELRDRLGAEERSLQELQEKQGRGSRELEKLGEQQVVLRETLTKLQESQGDLQGKLEQVAGHGFYAKLGELQEATTNELQEHGNQLRAQSRKWQAHHTSLEERLENVEGMLTDCLDKNNREIEAVQSRMSDLDLDHQARQQGKDCRERCDLLERLLGVRKREDGVEDRKVSYSIYDQLHDHDGRLTRLETRTHEEYARLWSAVDSHTHDLSSQTLRKAAESPVQRVQTVSSVHSVPVITSPVRPEWSPQQVNGSVRQGSRALTATSSITSLASVAPSVVSTRTLAPEELERISCGPARYEAKPSA